MLLLVLGLLIFLPGHGVQAFAPGFRAAMIARIGLNGWRGLYSLVSLVGLVLIVWGNAEARLDPVVVWAPPVWTRHLALTVNLIGFVVFALYAVPAGVLKPRIGHPMVLSVAIWAIAHLIANGNLADLFLFGGFLVWALADYVYLRTRDRRAGPVPVPGPVRNDLIAVALGIVMWVAIVYWLHAPVIGVDPLA